MLLVWGGAAPGSAQGPPACRVDGSAPAPPPDFNRSVIRSTVAYNRATNGGGIKTVGGELLLRTSTVYDNTATSQGHGIEGAAGRLDFMMSTVLALHETGAPISIKGTIVFYCEGTLASRGYNAIDPPIQSMNCALDPVQPTDHPDGGLGLGELADRGGPTPTVPFEVLGSLGGGVALDNAPPASDPDCGGTTDQRGIPRPQPPGGRCDIGAYEHTVDWVTVTKVVRRKKHGTARLKLRVSRPGEVVLHKSKRVRRSSATRRKEGAGRVVLPVRPRGKAKRLLSKRRLRRSGRRQVAARVRARIAYTPKFLYMPRTRDRKLKLVRRR